LLPYFLIKKCHPYSKKIEFNIGIKRSFSFPRGATAGSGTELKTEIWETFGKSLGDLGEADRIFLLIRVKYFSSYERG